MHALEAALGRQRQVDFYEFEASLVYGASYRTARAVTQRNLVSNKQTNKKAEYAGCSFSSYVYDFTILV